MPLWVIMLIIAGVLLVVGIICYICHVKRIGNPYTGWIGIAIMAIGLITGFEAVPTYVEGSKTVTEQEDVPNVTTLVDDNTIIMEDKTIHQPVVKKMIIRGHYNEQ